MAELINLFDFTQKDLASWFIENGEKAFRAQQLFKWIYHEKVTDFAQMTNISQSLRDKLKSQATLVVPEVIIDKTANDGTRKWVLQYHCGNSIEMVFIPENDRGTLCISSQAGCALACPFCSTAQGGFNRNLTTGEIVVQVWLAKKLLGCGRHGVNRQISNIVFMGMGEPLLNFANVVPATEIFMDDFAFGLSRRRITLSTSGVVPAIEKLSEMSEVSLAVSLHAPTDELRNKIVPINQRYGLQALLAACRKYIENTRQHGGIVWEYVMLKGVNDSAYYAEMLADILVGIPGKINLIPFNPFPGSQFECSSRSDILEFQRYLSFRGYVTTIRKTRGDNIDAACGQLVGRIHNRIRHPIRSTDKVEDRI